MSVRGSLWIAMVLVPLTGLASCGRAEKPPRASADSVSSTVKGDGFSVTATLQSAQVTMADVVRIDVAARTERPDIASVDVDAEATDQWADVRREGAGGSRRSDAGGRVVEATILLEPFLPGELKTPKIVLTPRLRDGGEGDAVTIQPMAVTVASVIDGDPKGAELADVKGVVEAPAISRTWLYVGGAAGGVLVLTALAGGVWMLRRGREEIVPPRPAHEIAIEALERLRERGLVESGMMKEFYFELSKIMRRYIEGRFGLHAPEQTTQEFLRDAQGCGALGSRDVELLERFLGHCDMVKFAKLEVMRDQAETSLGTVRDFVERTREPEPGEAGGTVPDRALEGAAA